MNPARLAFVPDWRGDETLYSWAARFHRQRGTTVKQTGQQLFGAAHACREHCAPAGVHRFILATGHVLGDVRGVLLGRTPLAAYFPFLSEGRRERFAALCLRASNVPWASQFGMPASALETGGLRWCTRCAEADQALWGEVHWRLPHQLPGVRICLDHGELLHEFQVDRFSWNLPPSKVDRVRRHSGTTPEEHVRSLRTVAALSASLMGCDRLDLAQMKLAVVVALRSQGVVTAARPMSTGTLQAWFASLPVAAAIGGQPGLHVLADGAWLHDALHGRRAVHPVKWLLLWSAAFYGADDSTLVRAMHCPVLMTAWDPLGQGLLWPEAEPNLDSRLKTTVEAHATARAAAMALGVSVTAVRRYMKAAGCQPQNSRVASQRQDRLSLATRAIEACISANPSCTRSQVRDLCKAEVSWFRRWAPETLAALLARLPEVRDRQRRLFDVES